MGENLADSFVKLNDYPSAALHLREIRVDCSHRLVLVHSRGILEWLVMLW